MTRVTTYSRHIILILLAFLALFPIGFLLINSVKTELAYSHDPLALPSTFEWHQYAKAFDVIIRPIGNSALIVSVSVIGIVAFAAMSAYAFTFMQFPLRRVLFIMVFVLLLIPG
ncbi:MAG: carbohydrate ABC transporter permease, partial [Thermomicrobiales bacterium]